MTTPTEASPTTDTNAYRARDMVSVAGLLSLARVPLAALFPLALGSPWLAFAVLATAALTDVLDGWYARRTGQTTPTGAVLDPVTDKLFVLTVVATLILAGHLSPAEALLLGTRELGELPLVLWLAVSRRARGRQKDHPKANAPGKAATALQFAAVTAALFGSAATPLLLYLTAAAGVLAALSYWARALRVHRPPSA